MKDLKKYRYHRSHRKDARIPDAKKYREEAEQMEELTCPNCNGSGEGMHDGTKCTHCKGSGVEYVLSEEEEVAEDILEEAIRARE